jgi:endoglycosylceramidase
VNARVDGIFDVSFDDGRIALQPIPPFGEDDCRFLAETMGMNLLRLPVNWSGIEPKKRGEYDPDYIERIRKVIQFCYKVGVYTLVDLHQDAYSKEIGEDGAPLWAIIPPPEKLLEGPLTDLAQRRVSKAVLDAFASFFDNKDGIQDAYADMAAYLANALKHEPGMIGLEIMNEPVALDSERKLDAFHQKIGEAVRKVAPDLTLFFEPNSIRNLLDKANVRTPFPLVNAVYSPHIYTEVFQNNWASENEEAIRKSVLAAQSEAKIHNTPIFIGEFGNDTKLARGKRWIEVALDSFDQIRASWAYWLYEEWSQDSWGFYDKAQDNTRGALREDVIMLLSRPFPARLAGQLENIQWHSSTRTLSVQLSNSTDLPHQFTVPARIYPNGLKISCDGRNIDTKPKTGRVNFRCKSNNIKIMPP